MQENFVDEEAVKALGPQMMNAFELITLSQGLNLSALFDRRQVWIFHILIFLAVVLNLLIKVM